MEWKDPQTKYIPKPESKIDLRKALPSFPYIPESFQGQSFTKSDFLELTLE